MKKDKVTFKQMSSACGSSGPRKAPTLSELIDEVVDKVYGSAEEDEGDREEPQELSF